MPSNLVLNHLTVSTLVTLWECPTFDLHRLLLATRAPGLVLVMSLDFSKIPPSSRSNSHAAVEVHAVDTNRRIVLDTKIDVF